MMAVNTESLCLTMINRRIEWFVRFRTVLPLISLGVVLIGRAAPGLSPDEVVSGLHKFYAKTRSSKARGIFEKPGLLRAVDDF
jgi:hypothetical protein